MTVDLLRLTVAMLAGIAVILGLEAETASNLLTAPALVTANITNGFLNMIGIETIQNGTVITQPHVFAYEIHHRCLGILPASALLIFMAIQPVGFGAKIIGICVGLPLLFALNITRLIHLFLVGIHQPDYFWVAHHVVWNLIVFIFVVLMVVIWLDRLKSKDKVVSRLNYQEAFLSK